MRMWPLPDADLADRHARRHGLRVARAGVGRASRRAAAGLLPAARSTSYWRANELVRAVRVLDREAERCGLVHLAPHAVVEARARLGDVARRAGP